MNDNTSVFPSFPDAGQGLIRRDLLEFESRLLADIAAILPFSGHSLYFPAEGAPEEVTWLPEEERLLLPLTQSPGQAPLGVLLLRGPAPEAVPCFLTAAQHLTRLSLEKIALLKAARQDTDTGLLNRATFENALIREVELLRRSFTPRPSASMDQEKSWHGSFGLIFFVMPGYRAFAEDHGHERRDELFAAQAAALAETLPTHLPPDALAAHLGEGLLAVLAAAPVKRIQEAALALCRVMDAASVPSPISGDPLRMPAFAGYALFPQDMEGFGRRSAREQAMALADKAESAARRAAGGGEKSLSFSGILAQGGHVAELFPPARVRIDLGRREGARPGQCFSVWSGTDYRGEIALLEAGRDNSLAEVRLLGDPARPLAPGDSLRLMPEEELPEAGQPDPRGGLFRYADFMNLFPARSGRRFLLALLRLEPLEPDHARADEIVLPLMPELRRLWKEKLDQDDVLAGRLGQYGILALHPGLGAESLGAYETIAAELRELGFDLAVGLAACPFLDYRPGDMPDCCRKALEYALLLPPPHVGLCDSLALNISADKLYSQGDAFSALEEYGKALLADEGNVLARNSLGVCLAGLGRQTEARRHFEKALSLSPGDAPSHYNLGALCLQQGDREAAEGHFRACLAQDPRHLFAMVRLGQLAEQDGKPAQAREQYQKALELDRTDPLPCRLLARLELRLGRHDQARECLHQALARNPRDAASLQLLARLYLDGGEDPELAESLARQSVSLEPGRRAAWQELARAMAASGKNTDAVLRRIAEL